MFKFGLSTSAILTLVAVYGATASASEIECYESKDFVVAVQEYENVPGSRFAVLPAKAACTFNEKKALFTIGSEDDALWFEELSGHHLVLSRSTGPLGDLIVYDLVKKTVVLDAASDDFEAYEDGVLYWERVAEGTVTNCPEFAEYEKNGFGAAIVENKRFNFASGAIESFGEQRCYATQ